MFWVQYERDRILVHFDRIFAQELFWNIRPLAATASVVVPTHAVLLKVWPGRSYVKRRKSFEVLYSRVSGKNVDFRQYSRDFTQEWKANLFFVTGNQETTKNRWEYVSKWEESEKKAILR